MRAQFNASWLVVMISMVFAVTASCGTRQSPAPTLNDLIGQYEAYLQEGDPVAAAIANQTEPLIWASVSPDDLDRRAKQAANLLKAAEDLNLDASQPDIAILRQKLRFDLDEHRFDRARVPFMGESGFYSEPNFAAIAISKPTKAEAEAWTQRLLDIPRHFDEQITNMRRGIATGYTAHEDPTKAAIAIVRSMIVEEVTQSPLYAPFASLDGSIADDDAAALRAGGAEAAEAAIAAYVELLTFFEEQYLPAARPGAGIGTLEGGAEDYLASIRDHTSDAGYTPEQIHQLGNEEVSRIRAEMDVIVAEHGGGREFAEFTAYLRSDPQFYAATPDALMAEAHAMSKRLDALLPRYFGALPELGYVVEPVAPEIAPGYTTGRYNPGDPNKGIPGQYLVNTYALDQRPLYELPALSAHEAVPGHHLQLAIAQELEDVSSFRRNYYSTAFGEGWGLYAERLVGEAGFYRTPYERFGQLSYEMWRACRLVADTGLHYYGWDREQAEACFEDNTALAPLNIETEVTRYIGWPGQATAYKIGELKILELRQLAITELQERFDIRAFHDQLLGAGSMPLDALEARMLGWIKEQKRG